MAIQSSITLKQEQTQVIPAVIVDVVDIKNITIETNEHKVIFSYSLISYERDAEGNITTDENGKKVAKIIDTRELTVGDTHYSDVFEEIVGDKKRGEDIEDVLISWIKLFDNDFSTMDTVTRVDLQDLNIL